MRISWNWLSEFVDVKGLDPFETANVFTLSTAEVEEVFELGTGLENLTIAKITGIKPHPDANKLNLVDLDLGSEKITVVSGAPNVKIGMLSVFAPVGSVVRGKNEEDVTIKEAEIRGVKSSGMLVSEYEIRLSDDHSGIIELFEDFKPGTKLCDVAPIQDVIWEVDNKSLTHRPDLWGHIGIAREVAAITGRKFVYSIKKPEFTNDEPLEIFNEVPDLCSRYTAFTMRGIQIKPAPLYIRVLLANAGQRPINNIVDFTNYVMLTVGNPLHAFDKKFIKENTIKIRKALPKEKIKTLDGNEHTLSENDIVISDKSAPVALAGVMGGENSEVKTDTSEIILESANFHPGTIRKTALKYALRTESSARFEKSLDPAFAEEAAFMFANLVLKYVDGSKITSKYYDLDFSSKEIKYIDISGDFIRKRLGHPVTDERIIEILESLDFKIEKNENKMKVRVPSYRATKDIGIPEDLVEEIGRIHGYGNITPDTPFVQIEKPYTLPTKTTERLLKNILSFELGLNEVMSYSFDKIALLSKLGIEKEKRMELKNPISKEEPVLRRSLVPNLLDFVVKNEKNFSDFGFYELGKVFIPTDQDNELPVQPRFATFILTSSNKNDQSMFYKAKFVVERIFDRLSKGDLSISEFDKWHSETPWVHPVRSATLILNKTNVGYISELHPAVYKKFKIRSKVALGVLNTDLISEIPTQIKTFEPLPKFPGITHDISVIVDKTVKAAEIEKVLAESNNKLIRNIECFDVYEGEKFPNKRSISFRMEFIHPERTLKQEEIMDIHSKIVKDLKEKVGGTVLE